MDCFEKHPLLYGRDSACNAGLIAVSGHSDEQKLKGPGVFPLRSLLPVRGFPGSRGSGLDGIIQSGPRPGQRASDGARCVQSAEMGGVYDLGYADDHRFDRVEGDGVLHDCLSGRPPGRIGGFVRGGFSGRSRQMAAVPPHYVALRNPYYVLYFDDADGIHLQIL